MDELEKRFPADIKYEVTLDTTLAITAGIDEIIAHALRGGGRW